MSEKKNILKESIVRTQGEDYWRDLVERAKANPFTERYFISLFKEGITSDIAGALGRMHDRVIEAATPMLISREIIAVLETRDALVRFPKAKTATAFKVGESASVWLTGEKYETVDVKADIEIKAGCEYTKRFYEDASWNVLEREAAEIGRAIAELETKVVYDFLAANAGTTLTGDNDGVFEWTEMVAIYNALDRKNYRPGVLALHPDEWSDLWLDDKFIHQFYWGSEADLDRGVLRHSPFGMKIVKSSKCTALTAIAVDLDKPAAVMLLRRDITTEPFENPREDRYGIVASERIGLGVLRSEGIAKMTSI
jgi:hypothetical protein